MSSTQNENTEEINESGQTTLTEQFTETDEGIESEPNSEPTQQSDSTATGNESVSIEELREKTQINPDEHAQRELDSVLSFTVTGQWGHFRRVDGNSVAVTYGFPPRTTVAGLISAILGLQRNSYYDVFSTGNSRIAVEPVGVVRRTSLPELIMKTDADDGTETHPSGRKKLKVELPTPEEDRQRRNYEVLVDPVYRIDVAVSSDPVYTALRESLEEHRSYYTPSLGKSEFLARIDYHGEYDVEPVTDDIVETRCAVPVETGDVIPDSDSRPRTEKVPMHMEQTEGEIHSARRTTSFDHVTYPVNDAAIRVTTDDVDAYTVGERTVVFL